MNLLNLKESSLSEIFEIEFTRHPLKTIKTETPSEKIRSNSLTLTVPLVSPVIQKRLEVITGRHFIQHPPNTKH